MQNKFRNCLLSFNSKYAVFSFLKQKPENKNVYIRVIFPVVSYGCEAVSFSLIEEHKLRVSGGEIKSSEPPMNFSEWKYQGHGPKYAIRAS